MTKVRPTGRLVLLTAVALAVAAPDIAAAQGQADNPNIPVQNRRQPDYRPLNLRAGSFFIAPSLAVDGLYDSNVFATNDNEKDDFYTVIRPAVSARSDWSRHALQVGAAAEAALYADFTSNDYLDFEIGGAGRVDVTRNDVLTPALSFARGHESRDDPDSENVPDDKDITTFYQTDADLSYRHDFVRVYTVLRTNFQHLDYDESGDVGADQEERDRSRYGIGLRLGYKPVGRFEAYVDGAYRWIRYDDTSEVNRDNQGYLLRAGVGVDITAILFGDAYVGFESIDYEDFDDKTKPIFGTELTWNVTPLTSIILDGRGQIEETTVTQDGEQASGKLRTRVAVNVWHELLRNVLVNGFVGWNRDDFDGIDRTDNTYRLGTRARYLLNRNFTLEGGYTFVTRDSDIANREYDQHVIRLGVAAAL